MSAIDVRVLYPRSAALRSVRLIDEIAYYGITFNVRKLFETGLYWALPRSEQQALIGYADCIRRCRSTIWTIQRDA